MQRWYVAYRGGCSTSSICHRSPRSLLFLTTFFCSLCFSIPVAAPVQAPELSASSSSGVMLLHSHCCFCSGLQVASSKQQQHAAHRGRSSTASGSHRSGHSPPSPGGCKSAVPAQWPSCSPAAHVIQDTWEDHRWACHRLSALWGAETSPSYTCRCSLGCRGTTLMFL